jgi:hypothetical protein
MPTEVEERPRIVRCSGETVDDAAILRIAPQDSQHIWMSVTRMDDDRQVMAHGEVELGLEMLLLHRVWAQSVVVFKTDLAEGAESFRRKQRVELGEFVCEGCAGFMTSERIQTNRVVRILGDDRLALNHPWHP